MAIKAARVGGQGLRRALLPPCMGAYVRLHSNDYPRQVVYGGQRAARPGQIGTQRLISQAQHEGQQLDEKGENTKAKGSQGHQSISDDLL